MRGHRKRHQDCTHHHPSPARWRRDGLAPAIQPDKYPGSGYCAGDPRRSHGFERPGFLASARAGPMSQDLPSRHRPDVWPWRVLSQDGRRRTQLRGDGKLRLIKASAQERRPHHGREERDGEHQDGGALNPVVKSPERIPAGQQPGQPRDRVCQSAGPATHRPQSCRQQPGQVAEGSRLADGQYTNLPVRQQMDRSRPEPGDTGCPPEVTALAPEARINAGSVIGLAALNAEAASGEGAHGPDLTRPATCRQPRTNRGRNAIPDGPVACRANTNVPGVPDINLFFAGERPRDQRIYRIGNYPGGSRIEYPGAAGYRMAPAGNNGRTSRALCAHT
jgi:hypothetical protein